MSKRKSAATTRETVPTMAALSTRLGGTESNAANDKLPENIKRKLLERNDKIKDVLFSILLLLTTLT